MRTAEFQIVKNEQKIYGGDLNGFRLCAAKWMVTVN